ncbi:MAG: hypothetical protein D3925_04065 [Candidatus Electrothrix sp. AR5]|nr:hypothetical protein [Candidatus Electrothrix sp. AR5]
MLGTANFSSCQHLLQGFFVKIKYDLRGIKKDQSKRKKEKSFLFYTFLLLLFYFQKIYPSNRSHKI